MDTGDWYTTVHGIAQSRTQLKQLSLHSTTFQVKSQHMWLVTDMLASTALEMNDP